MRYSEAFVARFLVIKKVEIFMIITGKFKDVCGPKYHVSKSQSWTSLDWGGGGALDLH